MNWFTARKPESEAPPQEAATDAARAAQLCAMADRAQAQEALAQLQDEAAIAEVALGARFAELRFAAAQRLTDEATIERVAAGAREHDKRVHRHCSDLLRARKEAVQRRERAQSIAAGLEALAQEPPPLAVARLAPFERESKALGDCAEAAACREHLERLYARMRAESDALRELNRAAQRSDAHAAELSAAAWPPGERLDAWRAEVAALDGALAALPDWVARTAAGGALRSALDAAKARVDALAEDLVRHSACDAFLQALDGEPDAAAWAALPKPRHAGALAELDARWAKHMESVRAARAVAAAAARPKPAPALDLAALQKALMALEQALAQGHVAEADRFDTKIEKMAGVAQAPRGVDARWKRARAELARLRGWAHWGTTQAHDKLIAEAELTLAAPMDVESVAKAVAGFREAWKKLDAAGPAPRAQWERFDALMEKAYAPVAAHRAAQAEKSKAVRAVREALLAPWEAWMAGIDWTRPDWRAVEKKRAEIMGAWHAGTRAGPRDERALAKRFDPLIAQIDARLKEAREGESARRVALIERAGALREASDLAQAMNEAKQLQVQWRDEAMGVHLGHRRDEELWKRFRAACDAVFARRDAERVEREAARAAEAERRAEIRREAERREKEKTDRRAARFTLLAEKAALAQRVEEAAASGADGEIVLGEARSAWAALPALAPEAERTLAKRLDAAKSATQEKLARGHEERAQLLLDLELALDLPSPDDQAEARRARQMQRLKERFGGGAAQESTEQRIVRWYAIAAAPDAAQEPRIAAVVRRVLESEARSVSASLPRRNR